MQDRGHLCPGMFNSILRTPRAALRDQKSWIDRGIGGLAVDQQVLRMGDALGERRDPGGSDAIGGTRIVRTRMRSQRVSGRDSIDPL